MKVVFVIALALASPLASAKTVTCGFTEPFFSVVVNEETKAVEFSQDDEEGSTKFQASELSTADGETRVVFGNGEEEQHVLVYKHDGKGSDGMSDFVYPYSAEYWVGDTWHIFGGCSTEDEKPVEQK